jgi:hypothetical protein
MSTPEFPFWHFCNCSNWYVSLAFSGNSTIAVLFITAPRLGAGGFDQRRGAHGRNHLADRFQLQHNIHDHYIAQPDFKILMHVLLEDVHLDFQPVVPTGRAGNANPPSPSAFNREIGSFPARRRLLSRREQLGGTDPSLPHARFLSSARLPPGTAREEVEVET